MDFLKPSCQKIKRFNGDTVALNPVRFHCPLAYQAFEPERAMFHGFDDDPIHVFQNQVSHWPNLSLNSDATACSARPSAFSVISILSPMFRLAVAPVTSGR